MAKQGAEVMTTRAIASWYGSGRMIGPYVAEELRGCNWVGVPFCGGLGDLSHIECSTLVVSDKHRHVVNLAWCVAHKLRELTARLRRLPFHPDVLNLAQNFCKNREPGAIGDVEAAINYFVCVWMGRSHKAGTVDEFKGNLSRRWDAGGGDSNTRYRSALRSLVAWQRIMRRCNFDWLDVFDFLAACKDVLGHALYIDAPWPDDGKKYLHGFTEQQHRQLAMALRSFRNSRVVVRFGDHPLIRDIYAEGSHTDTGHGWFWRRIQGRTQANTEKSEVLIINGPSYAEPKQESGLF